MTLSDRDPALDKWGFTEWMRAGKAAHEVYDDVPILEDASDAVITVDGRRMVNFASIGFLGWQHHPDVLAEFAAACRTYGLVTGGSRITQGVNKPHRDVESLLCQISGRERALTFASGLLANFGFVHAMTTRFSFNGQTGMDNTDAVLVLDRDSHWSMWKAADRLERGRNLFSFPHNDVAELRTVLEGLRGRKVVVGFETVYSSDGSMAPVREIVDLCEEFGALSFADDANGFMVYGRGEPRFAEEYEALRRATFLMVSFSKAVGLEGGALMGPADAIEAMEYTSGTSMFTASIQPPTAAAIAHVLRRMSADRSEISGYLNRVDVLREQLTAVGCEINPTPTYITSIKVGSDEIAERVRRQFAERGYLVPVFRYPAVRKNHAVIRLLLNDRLSKEQLDGFVATLAELKRDHGF
ncbi:aminotransferase class I/II-fold pyridoxal phosphate-dependent enzyme [Streptomyces nanshensis]|uniref:8-amino-7-oxononanoate synthase n=1 Tax=Streptomyces nanshensis TaxID=518642 RepID=A0A1E7L0I4_9ACTN|nr:pyridoxal phosphate-dependent aminotransferase family protein [Streptomyces nanshensis]OEV09695.1 aminotransferase class I/II [Streptomyces nanshensis]